tara:strand:- start:36 stop:272 length:237 start_codon:yes stop_codon:yes gene_type:complete
VKDSDWVGAVTPIAITILILTAAAVMTSTALMAVVVMVFTVAKHEGVTLCAFLAVTATTTVITVTVHATVAVFEPFVT